MLAGSHHSPSESSYVFRGGYSLCWELSSPWVFIEEDQRFSVLLCDRFAIKLRRKRVCHANDIPLLTGKQQRPFVLCAEDSPGVTKRCAQLCNIHPHPAGICHTCLWPEGQGLLILPDKSHLTELELQKHNTELFTASTGTKSPSFFFFRGHRKKPKLYNLKSLRIMV